MHDLRCIPILKGIFSHIYRFINQSSNFKRSWVICLIFKIYNTLQLQAGSPERERGWRAQVPQHLPVFQQPAPAQLRPLPELQQVVYLPVGPQLPDPPARAPQPPRRARPAPVHQPAQQRPLHRAAGPAPEQDPPGDLPEPHEQYHQ